VGGGNGVHTHLKLRGVATLQELNEARDHARLDHLVDGWAALCVIHSRRGRYVSHPCHMTAYPPPAEPPGCCLQTSTGA
jgi:hypothetical protein